MAVKVFNKERLRPEDQTQGKVQAPETKRHHLTREEEADRCLNHTSYSRGSQYLMVLIFLAVVFGVQIAQHVVEIRANLAKRAAWTPASGEPKPGIAPKIYHVVDLLPTREQLSQAKGFWGYWSLIPSTDSIQTFESSLKETSVLTESLLSPAQYVLTGYLGVGNEKAYVGRDGWLFFRPDVEYLTDEGFLTAKHLKEASHRAEIQPDPIKAILDFKQQLAARGITLVVVPMPTKPMIVPEKLVGPSAANLTLQNPSFAKFTATLEANGVPVYDPTPDILALKAAPSGNRPDAPDGTYLQTDTHWTPGTMDYVAQSLAGFIGRRCPLPPVASPGYSVKDIPISNLGDIAEMLKLPAGQDIFRPQTVTTQEVLQPDGSPWRRQNDADVMLLGDSFSNIFSLEGMNWGKAAGFGEHLSLRLGRPVDSEFVINSGGANASRRALAVAMHREDRLAGKKVVVYEFSMRDLAQGDWKMITLPTPPKKVAPTPITKPIPPPVVTPAAVLAPLKITGVVPGTIDPTKGQVAKIGIDVPKGKWEAQVAGADGRSVANIGKGDAQTDGSATANWDGKDSHGKLVAPGAYQITVSGTRPDGKPVDPVTADVTVTGAPLVGKFQVLGAKPSTIDPTAKTTAEIGFVAPAAGSYSAEIRDANGRLVKRLGSQKTSDGSLTFKWDGKDASGKPAADGKYEARVRSDDKASKVPPAETSVTVKAKKPAPITGTKPATGTTKPPDKGGKPTPTTDEAQGIVVTGRIVDRVKDPVPGSVPYKDALIQIQLSDVHVVSGKVPSGDIAIYVWGMRDNKLVGGAFVKGATVTLKLTPWDTVGSIANFNQIALDSDVAATLPLFFGELK